MFECDTCGEATDIEYHTSRGVAHYCASCLPEAEAADNYDGFSDSEDDLADYRVDEAKDKDLGF
jgi:hypothetical protein|tara:strand:- start:3811 stop:4002 length:192 start_codon:yes stop_codon:yes gene_type:complete